MSAYAFNRFFDVSFIGEKICPTSEMSHDHGRRAACGITFHIPWFHFDFHSIARGVTALVVGSGDLLGLFFIFDPLVAPKTGIPFERYLCRSIVV